MKLGRSGAVTPKRAAAINTPQLRTIRRYRPGEIVPESGIYRVTHDSHRLMHEATLLEGICFPTCRSCKDKVRFELHRRARTTPRITTGFHVILEDYPQREPVLAGAGAPRAAFKAHKR